MGVIIKLEIRGLAEMPQLTPEEAFEELRSGNVTTENVTVLQRHLRDVWQAAFLDELSRRLSEKRLSKKEKIAFARELSRKVFSNAAFEALQCTIQRYYQSLAELVDSFGIYLHYWLLRVVIKDINSQ